YLVRRGLGPPAGTACICPLSLHDALPISAADMPSLVVAEGAGLRAEKSEITVLVVSGGVVLPVVQEQPVIDPIDEPGSDEGVDRSEEHTSELQSRENIVCRPLLEKKKRTE